MNKFRKKPVVIEAFQITALVCADDRKWPTWLKEAWELSWPEPGAVEPVLDGLRISTLKGVHLANWDDWIIRGIMGELYPCKPDIFAATYEPVDETSSLTGFIPMHDDPSVCPENNIRSHAIAHLRANQPVPAYRVGDEDFDDMHVRLGESRRTFLLGRDDNMGAFIAYTFGTTTVRIYAGGPHQKPGTIEVIEPKRFPWLGRASGTTE